MAKAKEELEIDDEAGVEEDDGEETSVEVAKTNLTKRRIIDNLMEERRLQRQALRGGKIQQGVVNVPE